MGKALTKEDLIYILQSVLRISEVEHNAFHRKEDGLYVKDYQADLEDHTKNEGIHITSDLKRIVEKLSVNENDELMYNGHSVMNFISQAEGNMLSLKTDGFFVPVVDAEGHIKNNDIHVTLSDKQKWNAIVKEVEAFVTQELLGFANSLCFSQILFVNALPEVTEEPLTLEQTLFFVANDPDKPEECTYTVYVYNNKAWHTVGITQKTLKNYVTQKALGEAIKSVMHSNQAVLDSLSEDKDGNLLYKGKPALDYFGIVDDKYNAIKVIDGKLYARDYSQEINSLIVNSGFVKTNLYNMEINDVGTYTLKDSIDNYAFLLIEYFHEKDDSIAIGGCVKTAMIDTDTLREIYDEGKTYMLEYGYGALTAHIQFSMNQDKIYIGYRRKVSIYKITGIRGGDTEVPQEPEEGEAE